tara:strand:- start:730 stop:837 length:108 start_codon:yes stop_codon:yes gene_type:complete
MELIVDLSRISRILNNAYFGTNFFQQAVFTTKYFI